MAKPKKTRIKQVAQVAAQTKDDVVVYIKEIGDLSCERERLAASMNDGIAVLQEEYANAAAPLNERIDALQAGVQLWCEANRLSITDGGKVKFADFVTGTVKWRVNPPKVSVSGVDAVVALLEGNTELSRFLRVKKEVNKEAILNESELFAGGQVPGIKLVLGKEFFVIEPHDQALEVA